MRTKDVQLVVPWNMTTRRLDDLHCENNIVGAFGTDSSIPLFFMFTVVDVKRRKQSICLLLVIFPRFDCLSFVCVGFFIYFGNYTDGY